MKPRIPLEEKICIFGKKELLNVTNINIWIYILFIYLFINQSLLLIKLMYIHIFIVAYDDFLTTKFINNIEYLGSGYNIMFGNPLTT